MNDFFKFIGLFPGAVLSTVISIIIVALFHKKNSKNLFSLAIPVIVSYLLYWIPIYINPTSDQYGTWAYAFIPIWSLPGIVLALIYVGYNWYRLKKSER